MNDPEIDDVKRTVSSIEKAATLFIYFLLGFAVSVVLLHYVPEGFWLLWPFTVIGLYRWWSVWRQEREFKKELKALDLDGWGD